MKSLRIAAALIWIAAASWTGALAVAASAVASPVISMAPAAKAVGVHYSPHSASRMKQLQQYVASHSTLTVAYEPTSYTVRAGDTLSGIAARQYGASKDWPALWWSNRNIIHNPDVINVGQRLQLTSYRTPSASVTAAANRAASPMRPVITMSAVHHSSHSAPVAAPAPPTTVSTSGMSAFEACVISRESGGNPRAVNPSSGAGGLFQFLPSTWAGMGFPGLPEDAPVWMQYEAFDKAYAESGTSPWAPYDGC